MDASFTCCHCRHQVSTVAGIGTAHRNHCTVCLWSKHLDTAPGDRKSTCGGCMEPIGLTLKREGADKYGTQKLGDVMLVHRCSICGHININRIAADDPEDLLLDVFNASLALPHAERENLRGRGIVLLEENDKPLLLERLFGNMS